MATCINRERKTGSDIKAVVADAEAILSASGGKTGEGISE